jgi:hypothetical protein
MIANNLKRADRRRRLEQEEEEQTMSFLAAIRAVGDSEPIRDNPSVTSIPDIPRCPVCAAIKLASEW